MFEILHYRINNVILLLIQRQIESLIILPKKLLHIFKSSNSSTINVTINFNIPILIITIASLFDLIKNQNLNHKGKVNDQENQFPQLQIMQCSARSYMCLFVFSYQTFHLTKKCVSNIISHVKIHFCWLAWPWLFYLC